MESSYPDKERESGFQLPATDLMPIDKNSREILQKRAKIFSRRKVENKEKKGEQYICFSLGNPNERYGIPYRFICEVIDDVKPTKLPCASKYIAGVINQRGSLIAVVDLNHFFYTKSTEQNKISQIIVITANEMTIGLLVGSIQGADFYEIEEVEPPFAFPDIIKPELLIGLHRGVTAIINIEALLSSEELTTISNHM